MCIQFHFCKLHFSALTEMTILQKSEEKSDSKWQKPGWDIFLAVMHLTQFKVFLFLLAFDFCRFCVVIRFFHPRHNGQWPPTSKDFYTRSYSLHYFLILILEKEPVFPFSMLSAKQGYYWYHFYNVFGMTRSLTGDWTGNLLHSMPALCH